MFERNLVYVNGQVGLPFSFDGDGFAINPGSEGSTSGNAFEAKVFRNVVVEAVGTGNIKVLCSLQNNPPDFDAPSVIGNSWFYATLADLSVPNTYYAGATGVTVTAETKAVEVNTNLITWFGILRSTDTVDVIATATDNI